MTVQLHTPEQAARWLQERITGSLFADSRKAGDGDGFIAWPGAATDGRRYVDAARVAGVSACVVEHEGAEARFFNDDGVATYQGLKVATGPIAAAYFEAPSEHLEVVAITGTNGKTSTAWWLAQALSRLEHKCGLIGTLGIGEPGNMVSNGLTTPDPVLLQQQLRRFVDKGFAACALEAVWMRHASRLPFSPTSHRTTSTTTRPCRIIGRPRQGCLTGLVCRRRLSMRTIPRALN